MRKSLRYLLPLVAVLLGSPSVGWAYVVCTEVVNVYPNRPETHCRVCEFYSAQGEYQGEISTCLDNPPIGGPV
jgi:hypothetical protein